MNFDRYEVFYEYKNEVLDEKSLDLRLCYDLKEIFKKEFKWKPDVKSKYLKDFLIVLNNFYFDYRCYE